MADMPVMTDVARVGRMLNRRIASEDEAIVGGSTR